MCQQNSKALCVKRGNPACLWDCSGEVPYLLGSCSLLLLGTQDPCQTWRTAPLHGFLLLKWDLQSWVHSVCHNVKVPWRRHSDYFQIAEFFSYFKNPPVCLRWHLILVCICFVRWLIWVFFPTNAFAWLREILNIHDFLVITVWA